MHHSKGFSLLVCGVALLFSFKSHGLSSKELEAEVDRVSRVIEAQSQNLADAVNQVQSMTSEFQRMNGLLEQSMHTVDEQNATIRDSQRRLDVLEEKQALLIKQLEEIKVTGLLNPAQVKNLEDFKELEKGLTLVNVENYKEAQSALQSFLKNRSKSPYVLHAQYWLGETNYALRDYPIAITEFQKVVKNFPKSEKVAPALLKQGYAFFEMQSFADAKAFLNKLVTMFPQSTEAILAKQKIQKIDQLLDQKQKEALEKKPM
ncbi:MAG TPA: tol-pal system protein YbgF [Deltaproteobacteria bacterium]|nr:MAG: tol-pal system protein YbgF [Deltaproteobacteria bacterium GWA2_45_12]HBF13110.1 tol-pal system protein YbgF [Deltaproteobacteria bacterium]